jgi:hypothetical protein
MELASMTFDDLLVFYLERTDPRTLAFAEVIAIERAAIEESLRELEGVVWVGCGVGNKV